MNLFFNQVIKRCLLYKFGSQLMHVTAIVSMYVNYQET